jgi:hypothetical protein
MVMVGVAVAMTLPVLAVTSTQSQSRHEQQGYGTNPNINGAQALGYETCNHNHNDGGVDNGGDSQSQLCPSGNTCCRLMPSAQYGCIPNIVQGQGVCCTDDGHENENEVSAATAMSTATGCTHGYQCTTMTTTILEETDGTGTNSKGETTFTKQVCAITDPHSPYQDPLLNVTARYHVAVVPSISLQQMHGIPITPRDSTSNENVDKNINNNTGHSHINPEFKVRTNTSSSRQLAYYSSHGDIMNHILLQDETHNRQEENTTRNRNNSLQDIRVALIVVHGANRNADDYFYAANAAVDLHIMNNNRNHNNHSNHNPFLQQLQKDQVLVLAPWFRQEGDANVTLANDTSGALPLTWDNTQVAGTWRYGADDDSTEGAPVSSFEAMDSLVAVLADRANVKKCPSLQRIVVLGHSSGGQFVQRWALTSNISAWQQGDSTPATLLQIKAIVANPSNYAYLDGRRLRKNVGRAQSETESLFVVPSAQTRHECPNYNQWEYGLDPGGTMTAPYVTRAIAEAGEIPNLTKRYILKRNVVYMVGSQDRCTVPGDNTDNGTNGGWCHSHGLETTCADNLQGAHRYERSRNYYNYLQTMAMSLSMLDNNSSSSNSNSTRQGSLLRSNHNHSHSHPGAAKRTGFIHEHVVVQGVGHDHALVLQSPEALKAIFGALPTPIPTTAYYNISSQ